MDATFRADRLTSMTSRLSAAYKGINAQLMEVGARDFRSGQPFDQSVFFNESVDIHHIFPRVWCLKQGIRPSIFNSIINKTPLSARTNRVLGGVAPSQYLSRLEKAGAMAPPIGALERDTFMASHRVEPNLLKADNFEGFMRARREALLELIESAIGKSVYRDATEPAGTFDDDGEREALDTEAETLPPSAE